MSYHILLSPQVKRWAIITYKHGIYKLLYESPNELRLRIFGIFADGGALCPQEKKKDLGSSEITKYQESV